MTPRLPTHRLQVAFDPLKGRAMDPILDRIATPETDREATKEHNIARGMQDVLQAICAMGFWRPSVMRLEGDLGLLTVHMPLGTPDADIRSAMRTITLVVEEIMRRRKLDIREFPRSGKGKS